MSEQTNFVEESYDRVQSAFRSVTDEFEKLQSNVADQRKSFDKETQRQLKRFRKEFEKNSLVKRATDLQRDYTKQLRKARKNATKQFESRIEELLGSLQIASQGDVKKLDRKLNKINKQLRELDKARTAAAEKAADAPEAISA